MTSSALIFAASLAANLGPPSFESNGYIQMWQYDFLTLHHTHNACARLGIAGGGRGQSMSRVGFSLDADDPSDYENLSRLIPQSQFSAKISIIDRDTGSSGLNSHLYIFNRAIVLERGQDGRFKDAPFDVRRLESDLRATKKTTIESDSVLAYIPRTYLETPTKYEVGFEVFLHNGEKKHRMQIRKNRLIPFTVWEDWTADFSH